MPTIPCPIKVDCPSDSGNSPLRNISAEAPDRNLYCSTAFYSAPNELGVCNEQPECAESACSPISQADADNLAFEAARDCALLGRTTPGCDPGGETSIPVDRNPVEPTPPATGTAPTFTGGTPSLGEEGVFYFYLVAVNGSLPITFSIVSGTLPSGLSLNTSTGFIQGTPTVGGIYPVLIRATNAYGSAQTTFTFHIVGDAPNFTYGDFDPTDTQITFNTGNSSFESVIYTVDPNEPVIVTVLDLPISSLVPVGQYAGSYAGTPPITYTLTGSLPSGVLFAANGAFSGTPNNAADELSTFTFDITGTNAWGVDSVGTFTLQGRKPLFGVEPFGGGNGYWAVMIVGDTNVYKVDANTFALLETHAITDQTAVGLWPDGSDGYASVTYDMFSSLTKAVPDGITINAATGQWQGFPTNDTDATTDVNGIGAGFFQFAVRGTNALGTLQRNFTLFLMPTGSPPPTP